MTTPTQAPPRHSATGDQIDALASAYVEFASWLLEERELAPVRVSDHQVTFHLPDLATLEAFAASLGLPVVRKAGQWRAEKRFGDALTYVLWTEDTTPEVAR